MSQPYVDSVYEADLMLRREPVAIVAVGGDPDVVEEAAERLRDLSARFDPEQPDGELCAAAAAAGEPVDCSLETVLFLSMLSELPGGESISLDVPAQRARVTGLPDAGVRLLGQAVALDMAFHDLEHTDVVGASISWGPMTRVAGSSPHGGPWTLDSGAGLRLANGACLVLPDTAAITADVAHEAVHEALRRTGLE